MFVAMEKLTSIMDLSEVAQAGKPLEDLLQESLRDARAQFEEPDDGRPPDRDATPSSVARKSVESVVGTSHARS